MRVIAIFRQLPVRPVVKGKSRKQSELVSELANIRSEAARCNTSGQRVDMVPSTCQLTRRPDHASA
jgi:hypothetical protein